MSVGKNDTVKGRGKIILIIGYGVHLEQGSFESCFIMAVVLSRANEISQPEADQPLVGVPHPVQNKKGAI